MENNNESAVRSGEVLGRESDGERCTNAVFGSLPIPKEAELAIPPKKTFLKGVQLGFVGALWAITESRLAAN